MLTSTLLFLKKQLLPAVLLLAAANAEAQCCYTDNYTTSAGWTMNGTGYSIGSGVFSFNATQCAAYNYATHPLNCTLSDNSWTGDIDFSYTGRGSVGVAHTLLSATAGTLNSWNTGGTAYTSTNQDDIETYISCAAYAPQSGDSIYGRAKDGSVWNAASTGIHINMNQTYYIRLERLSPGQGRISVFTDAARTIHAAGSPQFFLIGCNVSGLTTIQSGCEPQGSPARTLTGTLSSLHICDGAVTTSCCYTDNYTTSAGWVINGTGYSIGAGAFNFNATQDGAYNYATHPLNCTLSDDRWTGDVDFIYTGRGSVGLAHVLLGATAGTLNSWNTGGTSYTSTNQDAIEAYISCPAYGAQITDSIYGRAKDGSVWNPASVGIHINMNQAYYIRLERLSTTQGRINVFTNAARTTQAPGSPQYFTIGCTVTGLHEVEQGNEPQGAPARTLTATLTNLKICDQTATGINELETDATLMNVFPNPNTGTFTITFDEHAALNNTIIITDLLGAVIYKKDKSNDAQVSIDLNGKAKGIYFITVIHDDLSKSSKKIIVQ